jgi:site-specific recombinase XerD
VLERASGYAVAALSQATRRAYARDFAALVDWCAAHALSPRPAASATVAAFRAAEAECGFRAVTITRCAAAIAWVHRAADHPSPCDSAAVKAVLTGVRRERGIAPIRKAKPLGLEPLEQVVEAIEQSTLAGLRDRAVLLVGFVAALPRSELIALDASDLEFDLRRGLLLTIRGSRSDQKQAGALVAVPYTREPERCSVRALRRYPDAAGIDRGPVFRRMRRGDALSTERLTAQSVALIVKRRAAEADLPCELLSGHSLRSC